MNKPSSLLATAALALASASGMGISATPAGNPTTVTNQAPEPSRGTTQSPAQLAQTSYFNALTRLLKQDAKARSKRPYRRGPGWTHAQVQRMARKTRNQLRNRKAHR